MIKGVIIEEKKINKLRKFELKTIFFISLQQFEQYTDEHLSQSFLVTIVLINHQHKTTM